MTIRATPIRLDIRSNPPPDGILLDADFIASNILPQERYHIETQKFLQQAVDIGTSVVYSTLLELEFWTICLKLEIQRQEGIPRRKAIKFLKENPNILKKYTKECAKYMQYLEEDLLKMKAIKMQVGEVIRDTRAMQKATLFNLYNYDTLHLATMFHSDLNSIASLDKHVREKCAGVNIYTIIR